jgi:hypothetical protein
MNPYPGLRPFTPEEAPLYMGREAVGDAVATRVRVTPLTVLFARSGVGKSSFLRCRVIPLLGAESAVAYLNEWGMEPPEVAIDRRLASLQAAPGPADERPVLVLDQFEDVFKLAGERDALWDRLAASVNVSDAPVHVLVSMREEWFGAWHEAVDYLPGALASATRLTPLTDRELEQAIRRPAELEKTVAVAADVVPVLLTDLRRPQAYGLGGAHVEAGLLQIVCHRLWDEAARTSTRTIDLALYERCGRAARIVREFIWKDLGSAGTKGAAFAASERVLWVGLTRHLTFGQGGKALVSAESVARQVQMRELGLAGPAAMAGLVSRHSRAYLRTLPETRPTPPADLVAAITRVLQKGAAAGFLKAQQGERDERSRLYELAHDALGEFLQQFAAEFEQWVRRRVVIAVSVGAGAFIVASVLVRYVEMLGPQLALGLVTLVLILAAVLWLIRRGLSYLYPLTIFPLTRRLVGGLVPLNPDRHGRETRSAG